MTLRLLYAPHFYMPSSFSLIACIGYKLHDLVYSCCSDLENYHRSICFLSVSFGHIEQAKAWFWIVLNVNDTHQWIDWPLNDECGAECDITPLIPNRFFYSVFFLLLLLFSVHFYFVKRKLFQVLLVFVSPIAAVHILQKLGAT